MLIFIVLYLSALAALGLYASKHIKGPADFFVAGRSLPPALLFSTLLAANLGAGTTVGAAELGYVMGLSAWWWVGSAGLGSLVLAFWVGPRIYSIARQHDLLTVGDYLELRYNRATRLCVAVILAIGSLAILAGQLIAMGAVLNVVTGIHPTWGYLLGGLITTVYFSAGGLWSASWVNLVQVGVKAVGFAIAVPWVLSLAGGWQGISAAAQEHPAIQTPAYLSFTGSGLEDVLRLTVMLVPAFFVSPGLLQKLFGARDERTVRSAAGTQGLVLLAYAVLPVLLGMSAVVLLPALENPTLALPQLLADALPGWLGGLMLAAILSAEISSADAVLFMLSTSVARDLVQMAFRREMSERALLRVTRYTAVTAGCLGTAIAIWLQSIIAALSLFYTLLTVSLFVPLLGGLFTSRPDSRAAIASMAAAVPVTLAIHFLSGGEGYGWLSPPAAGILVSGFTFVFLTPRRKPL